MTLQEAALRYAELGYKIFPCVPGEKRPLTQHGLKDATTDEFQIMSWWDAYPNANIGISTDGLIVIDRDSNKETGESNKWLALGDPRLMDLFAGPVAMTPRGGDHAYFRQPVGKAWRNTTSKLAEAVDTRANGGFVLAPPSRTEHGEYQWLETNELDCSPDNLPVPPDWLHDLLDGTSQALSQPRIDNDIREGSRNSELARFAGYLRRGGATLHEIEAALVERNKRCTPPLPASEVSQIAASVARYEPDQIQELIIEGVDPEPRQSDPGPLPPHLLEVPGLIRQVIQYNLSTADRRQPELALAAAIAMMGTITGRKVCDSRDTRTNVYCVGLCESGGGKNNALKVNRRILRAANLGDFVRFEDPASSTGMINAVAASPSMLLQLDELGRFLATLKDPRSAPYLFEIVTVWMKLFSVANDVYTGKAYADSKKDKQIVQPNLCIYGTTVRQSFLESLTTESLTNGLVSRLLVFEATHDRPELQESVCTDPPSEELLNEVGWWRDYNPGGNLSGMNPQPRKISDTAETKLFFRQLEDYYTEQVEKDKQGSILWTRATEKARKLALIYQCSADRHSETLSIEACKWAGELIHHLTHKTIFMAREWISDTRVGADKNRILRRLREFGPQSTTQLLRAFQGYRARELNEFVTDLIASGSVVSENINPDGAGRARTVFRAV